MDWDRVIEKNRAALKRVVAALAAMAGFAGSISPLAGEDGSARRGEAETLAEPGEGSFPGRHTLPRHLHRAVLRLLRPAEAAVRRLVIVAALAATPQARKTGNIVPPPPARPRKPKPKPVASVLRSLGIAVVLPHNVPHPELVEGKPRSTARAKITLPLFDPIRVPRPGRPRTVPPHAAPRILPSTAPDRIGCRRRPRPTIRSTRPASTCAWPRWPRRWATCPNTPAASPAGKCAAMLGGSAA